MKKALFSYLLLLIATLPVAAQARLTSTNPKIQKRLAVFEQSRKDFIVTQANLTKQEGEIIGKLLAEADAKRMKIWVETRRIRQSIGSKEAFTDEEATKTITRLIDLEIEEANIDRELFQQILSEIPPYKTLLVYHYVKKFNFRMGKEHSQKEQD